MNKFPTFNNNQSSHQKVNKPSINTNTKQETKTQNLNDMNIDNNNNNNNMSDVRSVVSSDYNFDDWEDESILSISSNISEEQRGTNFEYNKTNESTRRPELETTQRSNVSIFKNKLSTQNNNSIPSNIDFGVDFIANPNNTKEDLNDNISVRSGVSSLYLNKGVSSIEKRKEQSVDEILEDININTNNNTNNNFFSEKTLYSNFSQQPQTQQPQTQRHQTLNENETDNEMLKKNIEIKQQTNKNIGSNYNKYSELTQHEIFDKKEEILIELEKLEEKGIKSEKRYTIQSDLYEMERCYLRLKRRRDQDIAVKLMRKVLLTFVTGTEYMTEKFVSETVHLDGWSESVLMNIVDYDEVFEELYDKYSSKFAVSPEIKLLIMLVGSAFTFHMTKMLTGGFVKQTSNIPIPQPYNMNQPQQQNRQPQQPQQPQQQQQQQNRQQQPKNPFINLFGVMSEPSNQTNKNNIKNDELDDIINEIEGLNKLDIPDDTTNNRRQQENNNNNNILNEYLDNDYEISMSNENSEIDSENVNDYYDEIIIEKENKNSSKPKQNKTEYYDEIIGDEKTLVL